MTTPGTPPATKSLLNTLATLLRKRKNKNKSKISQQTCSNLDYLEETNLDYSEQTSINSDSDYYWDDQDIFQLNEDDYVLQTSETWIDDDDDDKTNLEVAGNDTLDGKIPSYIDLTFDANNPIPSPWHPRKICNFPYEEFWRTTPILQTRPQIFPPSEKKKIICQVVDIWQDHTEYNYQFCNQPVTTTRPFIYFCDKHLDAQQLSHAHYKHWQFQSHDEGITIGGIALRWIHSFCFFGDKIDQGHAHFMTWPLKITCLLKLTNILTSSIVLNKFHSVNSARDVELGYPPRFYDSNLFEQALRRKGLECMLMKRNALLRPNIEIEVPLGPKLGSVILQPEWAYWPFLEALAFHGLLPPLTFLQTIIREKNRQIMAK